MAATVDAIVKELTDSGIIAPGKLKTFIPPNAHAKSVEELISELIKQHCLTEFQALQVASGKANTLVLGNYTILDKIGAGGMGQVFKAEHRRMHRVVAIKMLPPAVSNDAAAVARFQREVEAAAKLNHPNIVAAHDADEAHGVHFLVMEYVEGMDLSALVKQNGPFPVAKAVSYILQAARGLEFAHRKGVIHRDVKPSNLLLDAEGTVKILDMGLARIESAGDVPTQAELTGSGTVMGTVDYMAPEQGVSTKNADARADIYSLGCTLYYLLIGKAIYDGETFGAKLLAHHQQPIPDLRQAQPGVSQQLEAVFKKMMAKKIEDRYQTMTEVVRAIETCLPSLLMGDGLPRAQPSGSGVRGSGAARGNEATASWTPAADEQNATGGVSLSGATTKSLASQAHGVAVGKSKQFLAAIAGGAFVVTVVAAILVNYRTAYREHKGEPVAAHEQRGAVVVPTKSAAVSTASSQDSPPLDPATRYLGTSFNLLQLADPVRDAISGEWRRMGGKLVSDDSICARVMIPARAPAAYRLTIRGRRQRGVDYLFFVLPTAETQFALIVDGWNGTMNGIELIDKRMMRENETRLNHHALIRPGTEFTLVCDVRPGSVIAEVNHRRIVEWTGDFGRLSLPGHFAIPSREYFAIGANGSVVEFSSMTLEPLPTGPPR